MSKILCIIDGMTDAEFNINNYKTLACFKAKKLIKTVPYGYEAETLTCVLSLLGIKLPPKNIRGWIEALGFGIAVKPDDLIFRGSWVLLDSDKTCINFCDAPKNIPELDIAKYYFLENYKSLLILPKHAFYINNIQEPLPFNMLGKNIDKFIYPDINLLKNNIKKLNNIDRNCAMLTWAASAPCKMPDFSQKIALICGTNVVKGIAKALNIRLVTSNKFTGDIDTDLDNKLCKTLEIAQNYNSVVLHIGGCDEAAHRKNKTQKHDFLKKIDKLILSKLVLSEHDIYVTSDHGSDPKTGEHISDLQPFFSLN